MIQKLTWVYLTDSFRIKWIKVFHLYGGFFRKKTKISFFIKGSIRSVMQIKKRYKNVNRYKKGTIIRCFILRTVYVIFKNNFINIFFIQNSTIHFKRKYFLSRFFFNTSVKTTSLKKQNLLFRFLI